MVLEGDPACPSAIEPILYGVDPLPRIVAVEPAGPGNMRIYRRLADDTVEETSVPFTPWLLLDHQPSWPRLQRDLTVERLAGDEAYCWLVQFRNWPAFLTARALIADAGHEWEGFRSPVEQYLAWTGQTLFKGMVFDDLVRLQLDIETTSLDPATPDAAILLITIGTNRGLVEAIGADGEDESAMLRRLNERIAALDPDIVEGHNLFNFDLPYLRARAQAIGVPLTWGRDGSPLSEGGEQRCKVGARSIPYAAHYIYGRHVIDTYQQIQRYDTAGALTGYGLKDAIDALGLTRPDRTFVPGADLAALWQHDRARVVAYALDDIRDVEALSALATPTEFYQTQMLPRSLGRVATSGTGGKINALLVRAYLHARHAMPQPAPAQPYPGGWTEVRAIGVFRPVVKCDVESLYPAIMLTEQIGSRSDHLGVMLPLLRDLTQRRLRAKERARQLKGAEHAYWQGLQSSFKVLINSFYGYLGFNRALFNDYAAAERITLRGQELIKRVVEGLTRTAALPIEIDTDGVYFVPPPDVVGQAAEERYVAAIGATLPAGINLAFDGRYQGMLSLKTKTYVLLEDDGTLIMKGSSLRSRREERFLRQFLHEAAVLLIEGQRDQLRDLYFDTAQRIQEHRLTPDHFSRWETITEKTFRSEANRRLAVVAQGQLVGERLAVYHRADGTLGLVAEWQGDEDVGYLLRRLHDAASRFADLFTEPAEFAHTFPLLTERTDLAARRIQPASKQLTLF